MSALDVTGDRPSIYIAGGLTRADDRRLQIYGDIREGCNRAGFDSYLPHEDTGSRKDNLDPARVFRANIGAINRSVAVVAEVSDASHGVGVEIQHAYDRGKPIVAIATDRADVSRMIRGHPALHEKVRTYSQRNAVPKLVEDVLNEELRGHGRPRSRVISLEGPDFVGKSTICKRLADVSRDALGVDAEVVSDPPWDLPPWDTLVDIFRTDDRLSPLAEAMLFSTARVDSHRRVVQRALDEGRMVICDRSIDSWFAYQSVRLKQRGYDKALALEFLLAQHTHLDAFGAWMTPGLTILLAAIPEELEHRATTRGSRDKYEQAHLLPEIAAAYEDLALRFPYRILRLETTGRSEDEVFDLVLEAVREYRDTAPAEKDLAQSAGRTPGAS